LPETGDLTLLKVDGYDQSKVLQGAEFSIYSDEALTQLVLHGTTDVNGKIEANGLVPGTYWVQETKPPEGYKLNTVKIPVTVVANTRTEIKIVNEIDDEHEYQTGTDNYTMLAIGGGLLLGAGILLLSTLGRRKPAKCWRDDVINYR
ncbi:MAG: prealbumin-like fold domain-containing protein, partial [Bacillota bacterium]|nr:prealbumin-like fold domain-containing protein [Bacillota bacterium]